MATHDDRARSHPLEIEIAAVLRAEVARKRLSRKEIRERTGIPETTQQRVERGRAPITVEMLALYALALNTTPADLIADGQARMVKLTVVEDDDASEGPPARPTRLPPQRTK